MVGSETLECISVKLGETLNWICLAHDSDHGRDRVNKPLDSIKF
jgi:hypothetical protein